LLKPCLLERDTLRKVEVGVHVEETSYWASCP